MSRGAKASVGTVGPGGAMSGDDDSVRGTREDGSHAGGREDKSLLVDIQVSPEFWASQEGKKLKVYAVTVSLMTPRVKLISFQPAKVGRSRTGTRSRVAVASIHTSTLALIGRVGMKDLCT